MGSGERFCVADLRGSHPSLWFALQSSWPWREAHMLLQSNGSPRILLVCALFLLKNILASLVRGTSAQYRHCDEQRDAAIHALDFSVRSMMGCFIALL